MLKKHWAVLTTWADYLQKNGLDPENQLCTDDFAGHFAHNTNLSVKAIMGIASYSMLADMLGKRYRVALPPEAARMAQEWVKMADAGDHYRSPSISPTPGVRSTTWCGTSCSALTFSPKEVVQKRACLPPHQTKPVRSAAGQPSYLYQIRLDRVDRYACADDQQTFQKFIDPVQGMLPIHS